MLMRSIGSFVLAVAATVSPGLGQSPLERALQHAADAQASHDNNDGKSANDSLQKAIEAFTSVADADERRKVMTERWKLGQLAGALGNDAAAAQVWRKVEGPFLMLISCIYNLKGGRGMKRTTVDRIGEYYDNLDRIVDWGEEIDLSVYDPNNLVKENGLKIEGIL